MHSRLLKHAGHSRFFKEPRAMIYIAVLLAPCMVPHDTIDAHDCAYDYVIAGVCDMVYAATAVKRHCPVTVWHNA